jgi:hypothetical protein
MRPRTVLLVLLFHATGACVFAEQQPLALATVSGVRIEQRDEDGDEWLHNHCVFHGVANVSGTQDAVAAALARHANVVEALSEDRGYNGCSPPGYGVGFFACSEGPR